MMMGKTNIVLYPIIFPILRCRPDLVKGTPIFREILDFAAEMPTALFHEKPPLFAIVKPPSF